jgi:hypothetical protein
MSPSILTITGNVTFNLQLDIEISSTIVGSTYNDEVIAGGTISLTSGVLINIQRYGPGQPSFGQRFTILIAKYNNSPSSQYLDNFPDNTYTLQTQDSNGRYLLVTPANTGTADGFPHTSDEYAVYFVRGAQDYVLPGVSPSVISWVQTNTLVGPGGLLENTGSAIYTGQQYINPLAASLMVMNDVDLLQAMLLLTEQERVGILLSLPQCNGPPYNATNFTPDNISIFSNLVQYAKTQPQYPLNTGSNASQIFNSKANISYFNSMNQQTQGIKTANDSLGPSYIKPYPQFKTQAERIMYIQGQALTAARNKMTGQNPSGPMGVPCSTIYGIINS